jgi:hypothetical protein
MPQVTTHVSNVKTRIYTRIRGVLKAQSKSEFNYLKITTKIPIQLLCCDGHLQSSSSDRPRYCFKITPSEKEKHADSFFIAFVTLNISIVSTHCMGVVGERLSGGPFPYAFYYVTPYSVTVTTPRFSLPNDTLFRTFIPLAFTRGFARKFQNVLKLCFYFHVL